MDNSILYKVGQFIEPVTKLFGLGWKTFMAFIVSSLGKEGAIGVLSSIFTNHSMLSVGATVAGNVAPNISLTPRYFWRVVNLSSILNLTNSSFPIWDILMSLTKLLTAECLVPWLSLKLRPTDILPHFRYNIHICHRVGMCREF